MNPLSLTRPDQLRLPVLAAALACFIAAWFHLGTILIATTNSDRRASDQQANLVLAADSRHDPLPMRTNAVSNALWPWLAAKLAWSDDEAAFFIKGKWLNLSLAAAALAAGALLAARYLPLLPTLNLLLLAGLGSLLPRAVYFQPEPVYYILFTAACVLGAMLLHHNPLPTYVAFGGVAGLAYLAKAGIDPLLLAWFCAGCWRVIRWALDPAERAAGRASGRWSPRRHLIGLGLVAAGYCAVAAPRFIYSAKTFGDPLFNMPKYWMWHDDYAAQSVPFLINYGHKSRIAALPRDQVPSLLNYIRTHSPQQILDRLSNGTGSKLSRFFLPETGKRKKDRPWRYLLQNRGAFLALLAAALCAFYAAARWRRVPFSGGDSAAGLFAVATFAIYSLAFGWYDPIGRGDRFMMTLYAPTALALCFGIDAIRRRLAHPFADLAASLLHGAVFVALALNLAALLIRPEFVPDQPL